VVEILSSALQGRAFLQAITGYNVGHFFLAIDIEAFTDLDSFKNTTRDILRALRNSKMMPSESRVYTAGEKEYLAWLERKDKGVPSTRVFRRNSSR
jgi:LDH2 family malate/lactate/ureidoglycolate dehydrogenase